MTRTSKDRAGVPLLPGAREGLRPAPSPSAALRHVRECARQGLLPFQGTALIWQLERVHGPGLDPHALLLRALAALA